jgi:hypothetical protein
MKSRYILIFLLLILIFSACLPAPATVSFATDTPSPQPPTETPTIVWFPPTATFTLYPTIIITPTADMRSGIGDILLEDQFDDPTQWSLYSTDGGSIAFGKNEITIVISKEREYFFSVRKRGEFDDFYVEITASPNMCREEDEYGMLLRASPNEDYYRFSLSCDGRVRLDRIYQSQASSPQPWIASGAVPPGAPSKSRLGVWAVGDEMRFFVNDEYQFTASDPLLGIGRIGIFARSTSDYSLTVNFTDLVVREINSP